MLYYTNKELMIDVWGNYDITSDTKSFVILGYVDSGQQHIASECVTLFCTIQPDDGAAVEHYTILAKPGDRISVFQEGVGTITSLNDPGTRVRIGLIKV